MPIRKKLLLIISLTVLSSLTVSCVQPLTNSGIFNPLGKNTERIFQPTSDDEDEGIGSSESGNRSDAMEEGDEEFLTCFAENPQPVAQDIVDKFETSYEMVEDWYCQGNSFEDIMLALMTARLWEIETDDVLLAHETKTWEQIWDELEGAQQ
jgi:hypothetical protein